LIGWVEEKLNHKGEWVAKDMEPVTCCKAQKKNYKHRLFLTHCEDFPNVKTIDIIKGRKPVVIGECNGFCGTSQST
jgi:hypothetical protein